MHAQSCLTLWDPMDCSSPGSSVHGISQARILEWVAISYSRGSSHSGIKPVSPVSDFKMNGRPVKTFFQRHIDSQEIHEKMLSITLSRKCKSKAQWDITSHLWEWLVSKSLQITHWYIDLLLSLNISRGCLWDLTNVCQR